MHLKALVSLTSGAVLWCASAWAQGPPPPEPLPAPVPEAAPAPAPEAAPAPAPAPAGPVAQDGARFRWGISLGGGLEKVDVVSGPMFGLDFRLGLQLNHLLGFYVQPHLSFGSLSTEAGGVGITGTTGTFSVAAMAEATFKDRLFAGVGGGYGVLNNPSGAMLQARLGGYPVMGRGANGIRRKGLMVGVDLRMIFVSSGNASATGILILGAVGYEAY